MPPPMIARWPSFRCPSWRFRWLAFELPFSEPKLHVLLTRRLTEVDPGAWPKLRGIITSPDARLSLKLPNGVHLKLIVSNNLPRPAPKQDARYSTCRR